MFERMIWNGKSIPALGLGGWAIGGPVFGGETNYGWGVVDDQQSAAAIAAAVDLGIRFFDTAPTYGAGHSETVLGEALRHHPHVLIGTKVGYEIDPATRQIRGADASAAAVRRGVEASLRRLQRDHIDIVHLHLNSLPVTEAEDTFAALEGLRQDGKIGAFGWSTDFPESAAAFVQMRGFVSVQHAMNVFFRATDMVETIEKNGLLSINRSPLAMGLLSGRFDASTAIPKDDIRALSLDWLSYFKDGRVSPSYLRQLESVRELLQSGGRTLVQGAIGWLWARSAKSLSIPGFRNKAQVIDLAGALQFGPLPPDVMAEIEAVIIREPEGPARER